MSFKKKLLKKKTKFLGEKITGVCYLTLCKSRVNSFVPIDTSAVLIKKHYTTLGYMKQYYHLELWEVEVNSFLSYV